jgi:hypothetical protein
MSGAKNKEEREFYINLAIKENLTHRELVRQMDSGYYERYALSKSNTLPAIQRAKQETHNLFMDSYVLEFLDAPKIGNERDFRNQFLTI